MKKFLLVFLLSLLFLGCGTNDSDPALPNYTGSGSQVKLALIDNVSISPTTAQLGTDIEFAAEVYLANATADVVIQVRNGANLYIEEGLSESTSISFTKNDFTQGSYTVDFVLSSPESDVITLSKSFEIVTASQPVPEVQLSQTTGNYLYQRITMDARGSIINTIDDEDTVNWSETTLETVKYSSMSDDNGVVVTGDEAIQFDERVSTDELFTEELPIYLPRTAGIYAVKFTLANTNGAKSTTTYSVKMAVEANEEYPMSPDNSTVLYSNNNISSEYGSSVNDITDDSLTEYGDLFIDPDVAGSTLGDAVSTLKKGTIVITFKSDSSQTSWGSLFSVRTSNTSYWAMVLKGSQVCAEVASGDLSPKKTIDADSENPISYTYIVRYNPDRVAGPDEDSGVYSFFGNNFGENHWDPTAIYDQFFMNSTTSTSDLKVQFGNCDRTSNSYLLQDGIEIESFQLYSDVASDEWCRSVTVKTPLTEEPIYENSSFINDFYMFQPDDNTGSSSFRIPAIITLKDTDGNLTNDVLAFTDVRFSGGADSPANIDTGVRRSTDGGITWGEAGSGEVIPGLYFNDVADKTGNGGVSASFIDPCVVQNYQTGRVFVSADIFSWYNGVNKAQAGTGMITKTIDGEECKALRLKKFKEESDDRSTYATDADVTGNQSDFDHYVRVDQWADYTVGSNGEFLDEDGNGYNDLNTPCVRRIYDASDSPTIYFLNQKYEVCKDNGIDGDADDEATQYDPLTVPQIGGTIDVAMNPFYIRSMFQIFRTGHLPMVYSDDKGVTWSDHLIITPMLNKLEDEYWSYVNVGPGQNQYVAPGEDSGWMPAESTDGRVFFNAYHKNKTYSTKLVFAFWSDDNGVTWQRGESMGRPSFGETSETVTVLMNDGNLRMFGRSNPLDNVWTAYSTDGGTTWGDAQDTGILDGGGCALGAVAYPGLVDGKSAVLITAPNASNRNNGNVYLYTYTDASDLGTFDASHTQNITTGTFKYSSCTVLPTRTPYPFVAGQEPGGDDYDGSGTQYDIGILFEGGGTDVINYVAVPGEWVAGE